jgi:MoxR-like ATPase
VTVDGSSHPLPRPFMVIATQNLVESYGTFPLPNSQLDRFLISMNIGLPSAEQELEILSRSEHGILEIAPVLTAGEVVEMQELVKGVRVATPVKQYIINLVGRTREHSGVVAGVSPRGAVSLQRAAQAWAAFGGRDYVVPEDVKDVAPMVLSHRILIEGGAGVSARDLVSELLSTVPVPV